MIIRNSHTARFSHLTDRLNTQASDAWQVHDDALAMRRRGEDVVLLSIGDPDFRTPEPIIDNAVSHMRVGRTHYSPALGEINLRRAVADYETRVSPHTCSEHEVAIFPGVTAAIYAVMSCLLDAGDEVVLVDPLYVGYEPIFHALDVKMNAVMTKPERGFEVEAGALIDAITHDTRVVFLNTPGNPTGAIIDLETLKEIAAFCLERDLWLVCDEIYSMFTFDRPHVSLRTAAASLDNIVVIDGLSKSHAMSGWRIGWTVAPTDLTQHLGNFAAMSMFGCPQFIQDAAAFALNNDEYYVEQMKQEYIRRRDAVCARLDEMPGLSHHRPESGMFIMIDVRQVSESDTSFAKQLLSQQKVSVLPGSAFGDSTRGHVRFSLVQPIDILLKGCDRIEAFLRQEQID